MHKDFDFSRGLPGPYGLRRLPIPGGDAGMRKFRPNTPDTSAGASPRTEMRDYHLVEEVAQNEYAVTSASARKPILATYGLSSCVGIAGFDEKHKIGFLTHYQATTDIDLAFGALLYHISQVAQDENCSFNVKIAGGLPGMSDQLVDELNGRLIMPMREDIKFTVAERDVLEFSAGGGKSLGIDTRTGTFFDNYDPLTNPDHRDALALENMQLIFAARTPLLRYSAARER